MLNSAAELETAPIASSSPNVTEKLLEKRHEPVSLEKFVG